MNQSCPVLFLEMDGGGGGGSGGTLLLLLLFSFYQYSQPTRREQYPLVYRSLFYTANS